MRSRAVRAMRVHARPRSGRSHKLDALGAQLAMSVAPELIEGRVMRWETGAAAHARVRGTCRYRAWREG